MLNNLNITKGIFFSQRILLELTSEGFTREEAYRIVQKIALESWKKNLEFKFLLKKNKEIKKFIDSKEIDKIFDLNYHFKNINYIFKKLT